MKTLPSSLIAPLAALFLWGVPVRPSAETVIIADTAQGFTQFQSAAIDQSGTVAFGALKVEPGAQTRGVYRGSGGPLITIAETRVGVPPGTGPGAEWVEIRDSVDLANGNIVFVAIARRDPPLPTLQSLVLGLFSEAGPGAPLHVSGTASSADAFRPNQVQGFVNSNGGYAVGLAGPHPIRRTFLASPIAQTGIEGVYPRAFNDRNQILYVETNTATNTTDLKRKSFQVIGSGNNQAFDPSLTVTETLATDFGAAFGIPAFPAGSVAMNNSGDVAYLVVEGDGVQRLKKNQTTVVEWNRNSPEFQPFTNLGAVAINDSGAVFFEAWGRPSIFAQIVPGIYRGTDPAMDLVVTRGGIVSESPIQAILNFHGVNNSGQVLATALLEDGRTLLFRTTEVAPPPPPPPPSTVIRWVGPAMPPPVPPPDGDSFGVSTHWQPQRVPEKSETRNDIALFDLPGSRLVNVGTQTSERLLVRQGQVVFSLWSPHQYRVGALSFDHPSVVVDNAEMGLSGDGVLRSVHALIGENHPALVSISLSHWITTGSLRVGGAGEGVLHCAGTLTSGEARIGTGAGGGKAFAHDGSLWKTGNIAIGAGGRGQLLVEKGGRVESQIAVIGAEPGTGNVCRVTSNPAAAGSGWRISDSLTVGDKGSGRLFVADGGEVSTGSFRIGAGAGATGSIRVQGTHPDGRSTLTCIGTAMVGGEGFGELHISGGALVQVVNGGLFVGPGSIDLSGFDPSEPNLWFSVLWVGGSVVLGLGGHGEMTVRSGATFECENLEVGSLVDGGQLFVMGTTPAGKKSTVIARGNIHVGTSDGQGLIRIIGGRVEASGDLVVGPNGTVEGIGTLAVPEERRIKNGGTISEGLSPGVLTIEGNYEQTAAGQMIVEIGGTDPSRYDQLVVTGSTELDGKVVLRFIDGFAPRAGQEFAFLRTAQPATGAFAVFEVQNLEPGFEFEVGLDADGNTCLRALTDGVPATSLPGTVVISPVTVGGITSLHYLITTPTPCQTIRPVGPLGFGAHGTRLSHEFAGGIVHGIACPDVLTSTEGVIDAGVLAGGIHRFDLVSGGQLIDTVTFEVPSTTLVVEGRLPDGRIRLAVDVTPDTTYDIEASPELQTWEPIFRATGAATYDDPESSSLAERYYRLRIGRLP